MSCNDQRLRPIGRERARKLRKQRTPVWWDAALGSYVWQMPPRKPKPDHAHVYVPAGTAATGDGIERCRCGEVRYVEVVCHG